MDCCQTEVFRGRRRIQCPSLIRRRRTLVVNCARSCMCLFLVMFLMINILISIESSIFHRTKTISFWPVYVTRLEKFKSIVYSGMNTQEETQNKSRFIRGERYCSSADNSKQSNKADQSRALLKVNHGTYHFMTITPQGRLGNQMFQMASLIGISKFHDFMPYVNSENRLSKIFVVTLFRDVKFTKRTVIGERKAGEYDCRLEESIPRDLNVELSGFFQSWKYFHQYRKVIKAVFQFNAEIQARVNYVLVHFKEYILIGVHIRRGDMLSSYHRRKGYNTPGPEYIENAIQYYRNRFKNALFFIVSDDISWAKENINGDDIKYCNTGDPHVDLAILSKCNHTIITSGSFGWWGAYLSGGSTIYFKDERRTGSWLDGQFNQADYYLPEWIGMR